MSFRLNTYIRVLEESAHDSACVKVTEDAKSVSLKDTDQRFKPATFNFPRVFTHESQVNH